MKTADLLQGDAVCGADDVARVRHAAVVSLERALLHPAIFQLVCGQRDLYGEWRGAHTDQIGGRPNEPAGVARGRAGGRAMEAVAVFQAGHHGRQEGGQAGIHLRCAKTRFPFPFRGYMMRCSAA